jgi:deoxyadenosine/deoxycytidine kinase
MSGPMGSGSGSSQVMFIGGRSGVGKTSLANEIHGQLSVADVRHCVIDGDFLDLAYPDPSDQRLAERNLAAIWTNYRALGYQRLVYTNSACVLADEIGRLTSAIGDRPAVCAVLLRCSDETVRRRLTEREIGSTLDRHLERSATMAEALDAGTPNWVHRIETDVRSVRDIATEVIKFAEWTVEPQSRGS